jgi:hypothetical protein
LAVLSLPNIVLLSDCKEAFENFRKHYCDVFGESRAYNEFNLALKESEGNFLRVDFAAGRQTVQLHNPSIRDYLTYFLSKENDLLRILIQSFTYFDQLVSLWNSFDPLVDNPLRSNSELLLLFQERLASTIGSESVRLIRYATVDGSVKYGRVKSNTHDQCRFILTAEMTSISRPLSEKVRETLSLLFSNLNSIYDWSDIVTLLRAIKEASPAYTLDMDHYLDETLNVLPYSLNQVSDYRQLAEICNAHSQAYARLSGNFADFARSLETGLGDELRYISSVDDIGTLEECADDIERVAEIFGVDLSNGLSQVQAIIHDLEQRHETEAEQPIRHRVQKSTFDNPDLVVSMFETLN